MLLFFIDFYYFQKIKKRNANTYYTRELCVYMPFSSVFRMNTSFTATYIKKIEKIFCSSSTFKKNCNKNYCVIFFNNKNFLIRESNEFDIGKKTFFYNNSTRSMTEHAELRAIKGIKNKKDFKKCYIFSVRISLDEENNTIRFCKSIPCLNCYNTLFRLGLLRRVFFMTSSDEAVFYCFSTEDNNDEKSSFFIMVEVRFSSAERNFYRIVDKNLSFSSFQNQIKLSEKKSSK